MKKKRKFIVFILSIIPGLSHLYLGLFTRGYIFMGTAAAGIIGVLGLCALSHSRRPMMLLLALPILWFITLIDSMALTDRVNRSMGAGFNGEEGSITEPGLGYKELSAQNKKIVTCLLSVIPGAGHMFLGYQRLGLELMTLFFFCFFFIDWLRVGLFMFIIPVIWFYSLFDALHRASNGDELTADEDASMFDAIGRYGVGLNGSKLLGGGLIVLGTLLIFDRIISPMIPYEIRNYLQTGIVALLFIAGGIRILLNRSTKADTKKETKGAMEQCENKE